MAHFFRLSFIPVLLILFGSSSCKNKVRYYLAGDFPRVAKTDAHFHYNTLDTSYLELARSLHFQLISPNVDHDAPPIQEWAIAQSHLQAHRSGLYYLATFNAASCYDSSFAESTISHIQKCRADGASGVKIWKNIGMKLQDGSGRYVMADDSVFSALFSYLEQEQIPLLAHLGEPRNCWLPLNEMTAENDRSYFSEHPEYHMFLHPEMPSYEAQLKARDRLLELHPKLRFIGAHLGSLEWSVDELGEWLSQHPGSAVDMAARINHLRYQSQKNREKVQAFMIRYQEQLLYATDLSADDVLSEDKPAALRYLQETWMNDWLYLATDSLVEGVQGLRLPADVLDQIYQLNALRCYQLKPNRASN